MTQLKFVTSVCIAATLMAGGLYAQAKSLAIGSATGAEVTLPVTMTSDQPVEGFVLSVAHDANLTATDARAAGATVANVPELVVSEILAGGFTLGVVMDFEPPYNGQVIPIGDDVLIAEVDLAANLAALALEPGDVAVLPVVFQDGLNSPPLSNIVVVGGLSIGAPALALANAAVTVEGKGDDVRIVSKTGADNASSVAVSVEVDNVTKPVEGFVLSIAHDTALTLTGIALGADAATAEFEVAKLYPEGGTYGVVMDFDAPYAGQAVPVGTGNEIAVFTYSRNVSCAGATTRVEDAYNLTFVNGVFGTPLLYNTLVEDGMSIPPNTIDGEVTFVCAPTKPIVEGIDFYVGGDVPPESDPSALGCAEGYTGGEAKVVFYYTSTDQPIQGISMAVKFDPALQVADLDAEGQGLVASKHLEDTLTKAINAEFVSFNADNTAGELIIGVLVDSTPPVPINHMYPPRDLLGKVINVYFSIPADAPCTPADPYKYSIWFAPEGVEAAGEVLVSNRVAIFNESYPVTGTPDAPGGATGCVAVVGRDGAGGVFIRGDCNWDTLVDIADPAATMSHLFLGALGVFANPPCLDACDSNDDGMVDLADVVTTLRWLFKLGEIIPPPYPAPGTDPTPDVYGIDLGCEGNDPCE